jgi:hypothetical protein
VANSQIADLHKENNDLRQLVIQLSRIVMRIVVAQRDVLNISSKEVARLLLEAMSPAEIASLFREVSLHCMQASRDCVDGRAAQELEGLSVELADEAQRLEILRQRSD